MLELKDELQKAEAELRRLKRQWMSREAYKKDAENKRREQLQPVQAAVAADVDTEDLNSNRQSMEIDKRKALLNNLNIPKDKDKDARRKFSGAHTRTLSLLSPERTNYAQPFPFPPQESAETNASSGGSIIPDTSSAITRINSIRNRHSYQSGVTHNVKLIAEDVKAGLWTFMEDIRQATIGDEASGPANKGGLDPTKIPTKTALKKSSKNSLRSNEKRRGQSPRGSPQPRMRDTSAGTVFDASEPLADKARTRNKSTLSKKKSSRKLAVAAPAIDDLDDSWSNWDSPVPKSPRWSGSTATTDAPPTPSLGSSDERGIKYLPSTPVSHSPLMKFRIRDDSDGMDTPSRAPREDLQWPALDKLTPGNLKRTVSTIMQEWEKSLTPSPDVRPNPLSRANSSVTTTPSASEAKEAAEARRRSVQDLIIMSR